MFCFAFLSFSKRLSPHLALGLKACKIHPTAMVQCAICASWENVIETVTHVPEPKYAYHEVDKAYAFPPLPRKASSKAPYSQCCGFQFAFCVEKTAPRVVCISGPVKSGSAPGLGPKVVSCGRAHLQLSRLPMQTALSSLFGRKPGGGRVTRILSVGCEQKKYEPLLDFPFSKGVHAPVCLSLFSVGWQKALMEATTLGPKAGRPVFTVRFWTIIWKRYNLIFIAASALVRSTGCSSLACTLHCQYAPLGQDLLPGQCETQRAGTMRLSQSL